MISCLPVRKVTAWAAGFAGRDAESGSLPWGYRLNGSVSQAPRSPSMAFEGAVVRERSRVVSLAMGWTGGLPAGALKGREPPRRALSRFVNAEDLVAGHTISSDRRQAGNDVPLNRPAFSRIGQLLEPDVDLLIERGVL